MNLSFSQDYAFKAPKVSECILIGRACSPKWPLSGREPREERVEGLGSKKKRHLKMT